jgi:pyridinium-3,5-biscarboxylic acid mononucleotide synthase
MDAQALEKLLQGVKAGTVSLEMAQEALSRLPFSDLGYARVDHHRQLRQGLPEVVFGVNKTAEQLVGIIQCLLSAGQNVLVTRVEASKADAVRIELPQLVYHPAARTLSFRSTTPDCHLKRPVAIVTAGTSDEAVAEEAAETLLAGGATVDKVYDVGVAGLHRLLEAMPRIEKACAVICVAGMEGALPSVLGGLVKSPVVAVPTSVGYGAAFEGITALFGMLTSCASGVTVVNIDNGFGAAMAVLRLRSLLDGGMKHA